MITILVVATSLFGFSFGINSFQTCDSAQVVFEGFDLGNNSKIAWREENAFFDAADCDGDNVISMDEFSCMYKRSGVDLRPLFSMADTDSDDIMNNAEYYDMLKVFDSDENGRIWKEEFVQQWVHVLEDYNIQSQSIEPEDDYVYEE